MNSEYKKYSLDNLKTWVQDALSSGGATPKEIYDAIYEAVNEEYYIYKNHTERCYELLALLNGNGEFKLSEVLKEREYYEGCDTSGESKLTCDKDDKSLECQHAWTSFWEEHYYPEEVKDDGMRPWGHSDLEYGLANDILTKDRISNFPGEQYTEEELNAMCDKAASDDEKNKCREYNLREAEYYNKRAELDVQQDKVKKWILPVEEVRDEDNDKDECCVTFPDNLLEAANLKEGDEIEWIDQGDGAYILRKVVKIL